MKNEIWDEKGYPIHMRMDVRRHNSNVKKDKDLCEQCGGTGNEFLYMYHECSKCDGKGYQ